MDKSLINSLHHVCLPVTNLEKSETFYRELLGLEYLWSFVLEAKHAEDLYSINADCYFSVFQCGQQGRLELFAAESLVVKPIRGQHFCLGVTNRKNIINRLKSNGNVIKSIFREGKEIIFIHDPDGHLFELKPLDE